MLHHAFRAEMNASLYRERIAEGLLRAARAGSQPSSPRRRPRRRMRMRLRMA